MFDYISTLRPNVIAAGVFIFLVLLALLWEWHRSRPIRALKKAAIQAVDARYNQAGPDYVRDETALSDVRYWELYANEHAALAWFFNAVTSSHPEYATSSEVLLYSLPEHWRRPMNQKPMRQCPHAYNVYPGIVQRIEGSDTERDSRRQHFVIWAPDANEGTRFDVRAQYVSNRLVLTFTWTDVAAQFLVVHLDASDPLPQTALGAWDSLGGPERRVLLSLACTLYYQYRQARLDEEQQIEANRRANRAEAQRRIEALK